MAEENQQESLRDALEASFESAASNESSAPETPSSAPETPPAEGYTAPESEASTETTAKEYDRDEKGKFAEPEKAVKKEMTPGPKAGPKTEQAVPKEKADPIERAPQAWKPEAREFWNQIPEAARREIMRTEQNIQQTLRETVEDRRFAQAVKETIRPFEYLIKAENGNPIQAIDNLMSTAARLRTGNANDVAGLVTEIVNQFGIGRFGQGFINALDSSLAGKLPQQQIDPYVAQMEQRVRQMEQTFQQQQYQQAQQLDTSVRTELGDFMSSAEFANDVRMEMADLLDMAAARGQDMTLQEAYDRACWANPEIRNILTERQTRERAQQTNQVAQKARSAAVSVGGSPAFNPNQEPGTSIRDAIEFAMRR
jgi:hypothetical protein